MGNTMQSESNEEELIRLPPPHSGILLTPPRFSDGEAIVPILNDPKVNIWLSAAPFPYTQKNWESWWPIYSKQSGDAMTEWREAAKSRQEMPEGDSEDWRRRKWVGAGLPMSAIRELDSVTGEHRYLGEITVFRRRFQATKGEERDRVKAANDAMEAGDPNIQWEVGFYLSPTLHGRGIMPAVLGTVMDKFMIPYMNVHHINGGFYDTNSASRRVFEKNNFAFVTVYPDCIELPVSKTGVEGKRVGIGIMRWDRKL